MSAPLAAKIRTVNKQLTESEANVERETDIIGIVPPVFSVMSAGAVVRCPGGCHYSHRVHRLVVTR